MSTRSTIIDLPNFEAWQETSEPQMVFGKEVGYNIYLTISTSALNFFRIEGEYVYIRVKRDNYLPSDVKIWGGYVIFIEWDRDGLMLGIKGGTKPANEILSGNFDSIKNNPIF